MSLLSPIGVDKAPKQGPCALAAALGFRYRVLYAVMSCYDMVPTSPAVLERLVFGQLAGELGLRPKKHSVPSDEYLSTIDADVRAKVRDALVEVKEEMLVELFMQDDPESEWDIKPLAPGFTLVRGWQRQWIEGYERLMAERGIRPWVRGLLSAQQAPVLLGAIIAFIGIVVAVLGILLPHLIH